MSKSIEQYLFTDSDKSRFWEKAAKAGKSDCWEWTGAKDRRGYGNWHFQHKGANKTIKAPRASWIMANGVTPPPHQYVCHTCDNPSCVNPDHLWVGTLQQNLQDRTNKGRDRLCGKSQFGKENGRAKITEDDVLAIRSRFVGGASYATLSREFGIGSTTVAHIIHGRTWPSVTHGKPARRKSDRRE